MSRVERIQVPYQLLGKGYYEDYFVGLRLRVHRRTYVALARYVHTVAI
jgi:hypothetical protein